MLGRRHERAEEGGAGGKGEGKAGEQKGGGGGKDDGERVGL